MLACVDGLSNHSRSDLRQRPSSCSRTSAVQPRACQPGQAGCKKRRDVRWLSGEQSICMVLMTALFACRQAGRREWAFVEKTRLRHKDSIVQVARTQSVHCWGLIPLSRLYRGGVSCVQNLIWTLNWER